MAHRFTSRVVCCAVAASGLGLGPQRSTPSTSTVVKAAAAYVAEYQRQLTSILADETYTQEILQQVPPAANMPRTRSITSEVFFMFAPATRDWMAIRDVAAVDGEPLRGRPNVREALATLPAREVAATFKEYNSRFNIGRTFRNFNEPTLSLLVLDEQHRHRFSFDRRRVERDSGTTLVTLAFTEKESPTLIFDLNRGRVFSKGELVVEAESGRVRRGVLSAKIGELSLELTTDYAPDERLGMWVPVTLREQYEHGRKDDFERIRCDARYSNYRRFETSVRIR